MVMVYLLSEAVQSHVQQWKDWGKKSTDGIWKEFNTYM